MDPSCGDTLLLGHHGEPLDLSTCALSFPPPPCKLSFSGAFHISLTLGPHISFHVSHVHTHTHIYMKCICNTHIRTYKSIYMHVYIVYSLHSYMQPVSHTGKCAFFFFFFKWYQNIVFLQEYISKIIYFIELPFNLLYSITTKICLLHILGLAIFSEWFAIFLILNLLSTFLHPFHWSLCYWMTNLYWILKMCQCSQHFTF